MTEKDWNRLKAKAEAALEKALDDGRGVEAKALYDVLVAVESRGRNARDAEMQKLPVDALGRGS